MSKKIKTRANIWIAVPTPSQEILEVIFQFMGKGFPVNIPVSRRGS